MLSYKLLTPGPLTTSETVKQAMLVDHCTWDDDYKIITQNIRKTLLKLAHVNEQNYTTVLMQGSGSFGVESVLTSVIRSDEKTLVISNGAYGERIATILDYAKIDYIWMRLPFSEAVDANAVEALLQKETDIKHVVIVHCETTTGMLNDIQAVANVVHQHGKNMIVDAMSSFGGIEIPMGDWHIDYLISSANKCIQGVPGFAFVIANRKHLASCKNIARSLSLDLYEQWKTMEQDGKWRFTSPTHTVLAFEQALQELEEEGGVVARFQRYKDNNRVMRTELAKVGVLPYIDEKVQSPFITTFMFPTNRFDFNKMYAYIKERGFAIYPGKLTDADTFRLGNIGEIYMEDVLEVTRIIQNYMKEEA